MLFAPAPMLNYQYKPWAVTFDGTNDYLTLNASAANSPSFTLSFWVNARAASMSSGMLFSTGENVNNVNPLRIRFLSGKLNILGQDVIGGSLTSFVNVDGSTNFNGTTTWKWVGISVTAGVSAQIYVGDVADSLTINSNTAHDFNNTGMEWGIAKLGADLAEVWFKSGPPIDFSVVANRRRFISATGNPVNLGPNGRLPTGTQPNIYLTVPNHGAASSFAQNRGSLGAFAINGALALASTFPGS
jgi:hypothetical protein